MYTSPSFIGQYNLRKGWLNHSIINSSQLNSQFDEPTYLSFKLNFYSEEDFTDNTTYDSLPQGLFRVPNEEWLNWTSDEELRNLIANYSYDQREFVFDRAYSAVDYLLDKNEDFRAFLLCKFIKGWYELQEQYQFYFQSVSGLDELFKSDPQKGQKLSKDVVVTVECLEAIDQRVKYLLSLYKAAAWDDEYQRWILPDIYRYFKFDIFISEIRTFHTSSASDNSSSEILVSNVATDLINKGLSFINNKLSDWTNGGIQNNAEVGLATLSVINGICPVTCIHCEMCDFDINSNWYQSSYGINNNEMEKTTFKVRIKKTEVIYNWTLIDRIFGNLYSNTERGKRSMTASQGWRDYLKAPFGPMTQEVFNGTSLYSDADLNYDYTNAITGGWISNTIDNGIKSIINFGLSGNILDFAADVYNTVRSAIAGNNTTQGKDTTENFGTGGEIQFSGIGMNNQQNGGLNGNGTNGANPQGIIGTDIKGNSAANEMLKAVLKDIGDSSSFYYTNVDGKRQFNSLKELLRNTGSRFKDLSLEEQKLVQKAMDEMILVSMEKGIITDSSTVKELKLVGVVPTDADLVPIEGKDASIGMTSTEIKKNTDAKDNINAPKITGDDTIDSSMEFRLVGVTPKDSDLTPVKPKDLVLSMTEVKPNSPDPSLNITNVSPSSPDPSISITDPSYYGSSPVNSINGPEINKDSSIYNGELTPIIQSDVIINGDMTGVPSSTFDDEDLEMTDVTIIGSAADTDGLDSSSSTDDYYEGHSEMTSIIQTDVIINGDMTPIIQSDVEINGDMTPIIPTEVEINGDMTSVIQSDHTINGDMTPIIQTEHIINGDMTPIIPTDVVIDSEMTPIIQSDIELNGEMTSVIQSDYIINGDMTPITPTDVEINGDMTPIIKSENEIVTEMTSVVQSENNISMDMTPILPSDVVINGDMTSIQPTDLNIETQMTSLIHSDVNIETDMTSVVQTDVNLDTNMTNVEQTSPNISTEMTGINQTDVNINSEMVSVVKNLEENETNMTNVPQTNINIESDMTSVEPHPFTETESIMDRLVKNLKSKETLEKVEIVQNTEEKEMNMTSLIDQIAKSQQENEKTKTIKSGEMSGSDIIPTEGSLVVLSSDGKINPDATVGQVIEKYSEMYKNVVEKDSLEKAELKGDTSTKNSVNGTELVGSKPKNEISPIGMKSNKIVTKMQDIHPKGYKPTEKSKSNMVSVKDNKSKSNKKIKSVL